MINLSHKFHDFGRDPFLDWAIIMIASLLVAVVMIVLGVLSYINLNEKLAGAASAPPPVRATIDPAELGKVLGDFDAGAARSTSLSGPYSGPADPSL